ncbi:hypothetical protein DFJ73DRAFT_847967 [Zopfochytrium polystomum]|nr:hypothetical protein DFJ73DRAFT_847967 [Zopfochytrium polystomum]
MAAAVRSLAPPMAGMFWELGSRIGHPIVPFLMISLAAMLAVVLSRDLSSHAGGNGASGPASARPGCTSMVWLTLMTWRQRAHVFISSRVGGQPRA